MEKELPSGLFLLLFTAIIMSGFLLWFRIMLLRLKTCLLVLTAGSHSKDWMSTGNKTRELRWLSEMKLDKACLF